MRGLLLILLSVILIPSVSHAIPDFSVQTARTNSLVIDIGDGAASLPSAVTSITIGDNDSIAIIINDIFYNVNDPRMIVSRDFIGVDKSTFSSISAGVTISTGDSHLITTIGRESFLLTAIDVKVSDSSLLSVGRITILPPVVTLLELNPITQGDLGAICSTITNISPVPEPSAYASMLVGIVFLAANLRSNNRRLA